MDVQIPDEEKEKEPHPRLVNGKPNKPAYIEFLKEMGKPAVSALAANAHGLRLVNGILELHFDPSHANLIPMLKNGPHFKALMEVSRAFLSDVTDVRFKVTPDPSLIRLRKDEQEMFDYVKSNERIQFLLEKFGGEIVDCKPLTKKEKK